MSSCLKVVRYPNRGRGLRSSCYFYPGDVIERCHGLLLDKIPDNVLQDYVFYNNQGKFISTFGLCALFNHSANANARWEVVRSGYDVGNDMVVIKAIKLIQPGEEVTIDYGDSYWKSRGIRPVG